jgi:hypothetical protein
MTKGLIDDFTGRRIVCAANRLKSGEVILGVRHYDKHMHKVYDAILGEGERVSSDFEQQGFICNRGDFWTREAAFVIATIAKQIRQKTGNPDSRELFSEDLY